MKPQDDTKCHTERSEVSQTQILHFVQNDISVKICVNLWLNYIFFFVVLRVLRGLYFSTI